LKGAETDSESVGGDPSIEIGCGAPNPYLSVWNLAAGGSRLTTTVREGHDLQSCRKARHHDPALATEVRFSAKANPAPNFADFGLTSKHSIASFAFFPAQQTWYWCA